MMRVKIDLQTGELVWFPLLLVYIHKGHETWYGTGMRVNRGGACRYTVHQPLTAFLEISAHVLEIADLGVDLTPTHDSCDWDQTGATCWVIMCVQSLWHMTLSLVT